MPYCIVFFQVYIQSIHVCVSYLVCVCLSLTFLSLFDILTNRILSCILIFFLLKPLFFCILQIFCCIISVVPFLCYLCVVNMRECLYMGCGIHCEMVIHITYVCSIRRHLHIQVAWDLCNDLCAFRNSIRPEYHLFSNDLCCFAYFFTPTTCFILISNMYIRF